MWAVAVALLFLQATDPYAAGTKALEEGKYEAAVTAFTAAVAADAKDYAAHFHLALAYSLLHRDAEGIAEYRKTLELHPGLYEAELNGGILLLRDKQAAEALPLLEQAAEQKSGEFRPRYYLAEAQLQTGALDKAAASFARALAIDAKSADAELGLAHALARAGKLDDAAPHYRSAGTLEPKYREYLLELAEMYEQAGQLAPAVAIYKEFPENAAAQEHLGQMMLAGKKVSDALPVLEAAYAKDATAANRAALAAAYVMNGQPDRGRPLLEAAVAAEPQSFDLRMMYARALRDLKQYPAAANQFLEAAKLKPGDAKTWTELGGVLYMNGSMEQSLAAFDRARAAGDSSAGMWFMRAIILDKLRQLKPALEAYTQFLSLSAGKNENQEFQARQRSRIIQRELEKR